jgi:nucleoside-diphosphate-sugar epimerase
VQELLGPGSSGIDKVLNPFSVSRQLATGTVAALGRRALGRRGGYPGLEGIFASFYDAIRTGAPSPTSPDQIRGTVEICEMVGRKLREHDTPETGSSEPFNVPDVLVTGGTGLLGREVVRQLTEAGRGVRVLARRPPEADARFPGVEYVPADLGAGVPPEHFEGIDTVVHCAAETAGGWDAHQRNSIDATELLIRASAAAGVCTFVHVSSVAVLQDDGRGPIRDDSPFWQDSRALGPYVWGKLESERSAIRLAAELGITLKVVRPPPLIDPRAFHPPGRIGRRIGNVFVAIGPRRSELVVADTVSAAKAVVAAALRPDEVPDAMNLVPDDPPTRRELVGRLREASPEVSVVWLPRGILHPLSWLAVAAQKVLRPRRSAVHVARAFASQHYEPGHAARLMSEGPTEQEVTEAVGAR